MQLHMTIILTQQWSLTNLPTLERRRTELQLSHLFKIVHNLCFFPESLVTIRERSHYNIRTILIPSLFTNRLPTQTIISIPIVLNSLRSFKSQLRQYEQL